MSPRKSQSEWPSSRYTPLEPSGPLPPGLSGKVIAAAYRSQGPDLKPKKILRLLGRRAPATPSPEQLHEVLRKAFDEPRARLGLKQNDVVTSLLPLSGAIYAWLKEQDWAQPVYDAIIAPAELARDDKTYLDPSPFRASVQERAHDLLNNSTDSGSGENHENALALFSLAFALLQPKDAVEIVSSVLPLGSSLEAFFGVGDATAPTEPVPLPPSPDRHSGETLMGDDPGSSSSFSELRDALQQMHDDGGELGQELIDAGTTLKGQGRLPGTELASKLERFRECFVALSERVSQIELGSESSPPDENAREPSIDSLVDTLNTAVDLARQQQARDVLDTASRIRHRDDQKDHLLSQCREATSVIRSLSGHAERKREEKALAAGRDPLAALVRLTQHLTSLPDAELDTLRVKVAGAFGDELARDASRGQLKILPEDRAEAETPEPDGDGPREASSPEDRQQSKPRDEPSKTSTARSPSPTKTDGGDGQAPSADSGHEARPVESDAHAQPERAGPGSGVSLESLPKACYITAWSLLESGEASLAYQIARTAETVHPGEVRWLPSSIVRAYLVAPWIRTALSDSVDDLRESLTDIFVVASNLEKLPQAVRQPLEVVALSALLKPALVAPSTDAASALVLLSPPVRGLLRLRDTVVRYARGGTHVSPHELKGLSEHSVRSQATLEQQRKMSLWLASSRQARIFYAPTTAIWRSWLAPGAPLGSALEAVIAGTAVPKDIEGIVRDWSVSSFVNDRIVRTDLRLRGRIAKRRPIEARAQLSIRKHAQQAVELLKEWLALHRARPGEELGRHKEAPPIRRTLIDAVATAKSELKIYGEKHAASVYVRGATAAGSWLLADLDDLFDPRAAEKDMYASPASLCGRALLRLPHVLVGENWEPTAGRTEQLLADLTNASGAPPMGWGEAFTAQLELRNHLSAERILDILSEQSENLAETDSLRSELARRRQHWSAELRDEITKVKNEIMRAAWYDLVPETTLLELMGAVESLNPDDVSVFPEADKVVADVTLQLEGFKTQRSQDIRARLTRELPNVSSELQDKIEASLARNHFLAANEYIDLAKQGRVPTIPDSTSTFDEYFPTFLRALIAHFKDEKQGAATIPEAIKRISSARNMGPVKMAEVPKDQARRAAQLLTAWFSAKNRRGNLHDQLRRFFEGLGCLAVKISDDPTQTADRQWRGNLVMSPIEDRDLCLVARYGSAAAGRYRLLCLWDRLSEEDLISTTRDDSSLPLFVLYFGRMTEQRRRALAMLARSKRRSVLVIDDTVVWYLCAERGSRLRRLFECLLPFSFADPYITTASLLPPEMFFGRVRESDSIFDPYGTNLVYGGRQLGKTALLRHTARRFHKPEAGVLVRCGPCQRL